MTLFFSLFSAVHTIPSGLFKAISIISSSFDSDLPLYVTSCPGITLSPIWAVIPSIFISPFCIYRSASRREHIPASLRYLFIRTPSFCMIMLLLYSRMKKERRPDCLRILFNIFKYLSVLLYCL